MNRRMNNKDINHNDMMMMISFFFRSFIHLNQAFNLNILVKYIMNIISYGEQKKKPNEQMMMGGYKLNGYFTKRLIDTFNFRCLCSLFRMSIEWKKKNEQNGIAHFGSNNTSNR